MLKQTYLVFNNRTFDWTIHHCTHQISNVASKEVVKIWYRIGLKSSSQVVWNMRWEIPFSDLPQVQRTKLFHFLFTKRGKSLIVQPCTWYAAMQQYPFYLPRWDKQTRNCSPSSAAWCTWLKIGWRAAEVEQFAEVGKLRFLEDWSFAERILATLSDHFSLDLALNAINIDRPSKEEWWTHFKSGRQEGPSRREEKEVRASILFL